MRHCAVLCRRYPVDEFSVHGPMPAAHGWRPTWDPLAATSRHNSPASADGPPFHTTLPWRSVQLPWGLEQSPVVTADAAASAVCAHRHDPFAMESAPVPSATRKTRSFV
eukprot:CAMPEP_0206293438 /NCGR_PEP_ID=MMETSP0106_2-20121207/4140_1 /ASSEMBLY_ACC=CAM_ASM_000206 /TAXON_ID=81532 /ORGANISM="Acanthoeca-like sp., Strain 10tr" /LENGTH=108 /DNA_ID=CAMNT_0053724039 /DNA_START=121 /DNA_END=447 /DNA_ORIENTATION=-